MTKYAARYGVEAFVRQDVTRESPELRALRQCSGRLPRSYMLSTPDEIALLTLTARLIGAKRTLEVGTFTGYSALAMAQALPQGGQVVALDLGGEYLNVAQAAWQGAGVAHKIELRLGDAGESLRCLLSEGQVGTFDLAFIDANQGPAYDEYYEACLKLLRPGGVVALENMLWSGSVADARTRDHTAHALRQLNLKLHADMRLDMALVTVGDGLMLVRKR